MNQYGKMNVYPTYSLEFNPNLHKYITIGEHEMFILGIGLAGIIMMFEAIRRNYGAV